MATLIDRPLTLEPVKELGTIDITDNLLTHDLRLEHSPTTARTVWIPGREIAQDGRRAARGAWWIEPPGIGGQEWEAGAYGRGPARPCNGPASNHDWDKMTPVGKVSAARP